MNPRFSLHLLAALCPGLAFCQEPDPPTGTRIPGELTVSRFVPPPAKVPEEVPEMQIEGISGRRLPTQRITILRGEASHLPDIPREEVKKSPTREELDARNDFLARHRPPVFLQLGATIYDHGSVP